MTQRDEHRRQGAKVVACLLGIVLALAACSSDSKPSASGASSNSSAPAASSTSAPAGAITQTSNPPRTGGFVGARVDVTNLSCVKAGDGWDVSGTVTNPTGAPVDYRIFTSFLDDKNDTSGLLQTDVKNVAAGAPQTWNGHLAVPGDNLHCVLRVERTDPGAP